MTEHIELNESQQEFIREHFVTGDILFDSVEYFETEGRSLVSTNIVFTATDQGVIVNEDYLCDLDWIAAYPTTVEVEFKRRRK